MSTTVRRIDGRHQPLQIDCLEGHRATAERGHDELSGVFLGSYFCGKCRMYRCAKCHDWVSMDEGSTEDLGLCLLCDFPEADRC